MGPRTLASARSTTYDRRTATRSVAMAGGARGSGAGSECAARPLRRTPAHPGAMPVAGRKRVIIDTDIGIGARGAAASVFFLFPARGCPHGAPRPPAVAPRLPRETHSDAGPTGPIFLSSR